MLLSCVFTRSVLNDTCRLTLSILCVWRRAARTEQWDAAFLNGTSVVCALCQLPDQWDPHGSPQANLSGPVLPPGTPFPNQPQHRTSVPDSTEGFDLNKPDPYDLYEKSRAIYESRREFGEGVSRSHSNLRRRVVTRTGVCQAQSTRRWRSTC